MFTKNRPEIVRTHGDLSAIIDAWRKKGERIGFVPTMGALHDGHISLVAQAQRRTERSVVSIFVNPKQFGPNEDFARYPRQEESDIEKLSKAGVDLVYMPTPDVIYPAGKKTDLTAGPAADGLESDSRPGFFNGVVSVVAQLFEHVRPDIAIFGEKDYQQLCVVREAFPEIAIEGGPVVRDEYGLALSSRNAYLSPAELTVARKLNGILFETSRSPSPSSLARAKEDLLTAGFDSVEYLDVRWGHLLAAVRLGQTRLIDNVAVTYKEP